MRWRTEEFLGFCLNLLRVSLSRCHFNFSEVSRSMNSKLDGAGVAHADQRWTPPLRMPISEGDGIPEPEAIRSTPSAAAGKASTRHERIAVVAYELAEARGFAPGYEVEDWLIAESQVDAQDAGAFAD